MPERIACRGIILDGDRMLVVKLKPEDDYYCLPGGTLEKYEELDQCINREMVEELGITPVIGNIIFIHEVVLPNKLHLLEFFYKIENVQDFRNIDNGNASHAFEISEIKWINIYDNISFLPQGLLSQLRNSSEKDLEKTRRILSH